MQEIFVLQGGQIYGPGFGLKPPRKMSTSIERRREQPTLDAPPPKTRFEHAS